MHGNDDQAIKFFSHLIGSVPEVFSYCKKSRIGHYFSKFSSNIFNILLEFAKILSRFPLFSLRRKLQGQILVICFVSITFFLASCQREPVSASARIITVHAASRQSVLYFDGTIQAIRTYSLTSPIEGTVKKRFFFPGIAVSKNQLLLVIASDKMRTVYRDALIAYIKTTRDYNNNKIEMQGTEVLKKYGIVSNEEYLAAKAKAQDIAFEREQALSKLTEILISLQMPLSILSKLNPSDIKSIEAILPTSPTINIFSPATGIIFPPSNNSPGFSSSSNDISSLSPGSIIKTDSTLINVYDMSGLTIPIQLNEMQIGNIQEGAKVTITGDAFPNFILEGTVHIKQRLSASELSGGRTASYGVFVDVPHLTLEQQAQLRIGMSATVKIPVNQAAVASIPLTAVYQKGAESFVKRINPQTEQPEETLVKVGKTGLMTIEIMEGLTPGDRILANAP